MTILVLGGGYIGKAFEADGGYLVTRGEVDYTRESQFEAILGNVSPIAVVNCAGMTGRPNIDECEEKRQETIRANIVLPAMLSRSCERANIPFVHISSGCIYQGGPFNEDEKPEYGKLSFYSLSKAIAEEAVNGYVLRIRMPFGLAAHPRSFITKIRGYPKLINYDNSLTFIPDLVKATHALLDAKAPRGTYNVVNSGSVRHREIVDIFNHYGHNWRPTFIGATEFALMVKARRSNCTLTNDKIGRYCRMPSVLQRLHEAAMFQKGAKIDLKPLDFGILAA